MSPIEQFWWNWYVNLAVAIGTLGAVLVALFGARWRARLFVPKLKVDLLEQFGEATDTEITSPEGNKRTEKARVYYLRVSNQVPWPSASQVQVYIIRVEKPDASGQLQINWSGDVPLQWKFQEIRPLALTIGQAVDCQLCTVVREKWFELHPIIFPMNFQKRYRKPEDVPFDIVISLQARSNETESPVCRLKIAWNGLWAEDREEMARHMVVKELPATNYVNG